MLEAARLDGASELYIFVKIGIPLGKAGIGAIAILSVLEYWNAIEAPLVFCSNGHTGQFHYICQIYRSKMRELR